jgi:hypothetical protein
MESLAKRECLDHQPFTLGKGAQVMLSPDAKWVMQHFSNGNPDGWRNAFVSTVTGKNSMAIATQLRSITSGEWSPDSLRLAFGGQGKVYIYIPGAKRCMKIRVPNGRVHQVWWSDPTTLKVATKQGNINTYQVVYNHSYEQINILHNRADGNVVVFGDDSCAAVTYEKENRKLILNLESCKSFCRFVSSDISELNSLAISRNGQTVIATTPEGLLVCNPKKQHPLVLCDEFEACNLCAVSPSGNSYVFTSRNRVFGIVNDVVVHDISFDPDLYFSELYFTSEKTYVVVLQRRNDGFSVKLARHTLP